VASTFTGMSRKWPHVPRLAIGPAGHAGAAPEAGTDAQGIHLGMTRYLEQG
jgi:hypothetical protein